MDTLLVKRIKSGEELKKYIERGITLIDFGTPWCAPCYLQEPIIHQLATKFKGKALIALMNIDDNSDVVMGLGIYNIPTLIIFKDGKEIKRFAGLQSDVILSKALNEVLKFDDSFTPMA